jgi:hypothetical protein
VSPLPPSRAPSSPPSLSMHYFTEVLPDPGRPAGKPPVTARVWEASILWHKGATSIEVLDEGRRMEVFECLVTRELLFSCHARHRLTAISPLQTSATAGTECVSPTTCPPLIHSPPFDHQPLHDGESRYWRPFSPHRSDPSSSTTHQAPPMSNYSGNSSGHHHQPLVPSASYSQPPSHNQRTSSPAPQGSSQRRSSHSQYRRPTGAELFSAAQVGADLYSAAQAASAPSYVLDARDPAVHPYAAPYASRAGHDPRAMVTYASPPHARSNGHSHSHAQTFTTAPAEQTRLHHVDV